MYKQSNVTLPLTVKKANTTGKIRHFPVLIVFALISTFANANNYTINHTKDDKGVECNTLLTVIQ